MIKKAFAIAALFIIFLQPQFINAEERNQIEIFDPQQEKVVKTIDTDQEINKMVQGWISQIDGIYQEVDPIKDDGYAVRFPINPAIEVKNQWIDTNVKELYLIIPKDNQPFFMLFEAETRPFYFTFDHDVTELSNILDFKLR